jgi:transcriptional regulator with XRE-family HTH domain
MKTYSSNLIDDLLDSIDPLDQGKADAKMMLAAKIADAMKAKKWKKQDLLRAVGKDNPSIITKWLSGTHNFTVDTLIELQHALDITLLDLADQGETVLAKYHQSVSQKVLIVADMTLMKEMLDIHKNATTTSSFIFSQNKHSNQPGAMA